MKPKMTLSFEVVLRNGAFHPVDDLPASIPEGARAQVVYEVEDQTQPKPRIFGLHAGLVGWDPTFDDDLPDSFWLGEE